jgi:choline dehydrogenase-like flavoprotein
LKAYDYVIVGAGSAGCVLAARLSEDEDVSVLVIEAGPPDEKENIHVPAAFGSLFKSDVDWDYATMPEPGCNSRMMYMPRGKTLGGSSSINAMVYIRGAQADYDAWRDLGNPGWAYEEVLPYFKRSEDNERGESHYHGVGGPLSVCESRSNNPMADAWVEAALAAGLEPNDDFNAASQDGVGRYQVTQREGMRCSTAVAFLHPATDRPNLTIETRTQVHRLLLEGTRAVGVAGERDGKPVEFRAEREVLLCAGAYNSPQLLLLSGIGPADEVAAREIEVVLDLPGVGRNLQDHVQIGGIWTTEEPVSLILGAEAEQQEAFAERGEGPLTSNVAESGGFWRSDPDLPAPDLQFHCAPVMFVDEGLGDPVAHGLSFGVCLLTPRSVGAVSLRSADPAAKPAIRHNFYGEAEDVERIKVGLRKVYEIARQKPLAPYCRDLWLGPASDDDADLRAHMSANSQVLYHPAGTCAMGSGADAVVDSELRVHGIEGLRVADTSIMPTVVRGNTNAPTIMIGERAADLVRGHVSVEAGVAQVG